MNIQLSKGRVAIAFIVTLCVALAQVPKSVAADPVTVGMGVGSAVLSYLDGRKRDRQYRDLKRSLDEVKNMIRELDPKFAAIQEALVELGDYVRSQFESLYRTRVQSLIDIVNQDMEIWSSNPRSNADNIKQAHGELREASISLQTRPPDAYDLVASAMIYEDMLIAMMPRSSVNRYAIFENYATYFTHIPVILTPKRDRLLEDVKTLETWHRNLAKQPILQYVKDRRVEGAGCYQMRQNIFRSIKGTLKDGYTLTDELVYKNAACEIRDKPRECMGRNCPFVDPANVGTPAPEDQPVVIPAHINIAELTASRGDWMTRTARLALLQQMIDDSNQYARAAHELARLR